MKPIKFPECNGILAEGQEEYLDLPVYRDDTSDGTIVCCWKLTWKERFKLLFTGELWLSVLTFRQALQPLRPDVDCPFVRGKK